MVIPLGKFSLYMLTDKQIASASNIDQIAGLVSKCDRCVLYKTKTKDVPGIGASKAETMFIGEAPGKDEDLKGEPFVGAAGKFLTEMIEDLGWKRDDVYIANVLKHRPPNNRDPLPNEVEACWPFLARQIEIITPKLIVFLGRHALQRFFPSLSISKVHGQAFKREFNGKTQNFLALFHPAAALYNGGMKDTLREDFNKIPIVLDQIKAQTTNKEQLTTDKEKPKQEKLF